MKSGKAKSALYLLLIFLCGFLAGAVATNVWTSWDVTANRARADSSSDPKLRSSERAVERFKRHLELTPEQVSQFHQILDETRRAYRQHEREIENIRQQGNARIRTILSDQQKAKFDEMIAQRELKRNRRDKSDR